MRALEAILLLGFFSWPTEARGQGNVERIYFSGPKSSKVEDLQKAAQGLVSRCEVYGYKGIVSTLVDRNQGKQVELSCPTGFPDPMQETIARLARLPGNTVEVRVPYRMSVAESEQFKPGPFDLPEKDTNPKGAKWFRGIMGSFEDDNSRQNIVLLYETRVIPKAALTGLKKDTTRRSRSPMDLDGGSSYYELSVSGTKQAQAQASNRVKDGSPIGGAYFVIDGKALSPVALSLWKSEVDVSNPIQDTWKPLANGQVFLPTELAKSLDPVIKHPIPFALARSH